MIRPLDDNELLAVPRSEPVGCLGRARDIAQRLGMTVLLERIGAPASEWSLVRDGADWLLTAGEERARLRDGRGVHYLSGCASCGK